MTSGRPGQDGRVQGMAIGAASRGYRARQTRLGTIISVHTSKPATVDRTRLLTPPSPSDALEIEVQASSDVRRRRESGRGGRGGEGMRRARMAESARTG